MKYVHGEGTIVREIPDLLQMEFEVEPLAAQTRLVTPQSSSSRALHCCNITVGIAEVIIRIICMVSV